MSREEPRSLSPREQEICRLAGLGRTDKAIAVELGISEETVASYWRRIHAKWGTENRAAAAVLFVQTRDYFAPLQ